MPRLFTRPKNKLNRSTAPYDFKNASREEFEMQQTTIEELKARCDRYEAMLATLSSPVRAKMLRATNFRADAVADMLAQHPGYTFIRIYNGIDEQGNHLMFMAPAGHDGASFTEEDTIWLDDCCRCPPMGNCPADPILDS